MAGVCFYADISICVHPHPSYSCEMNFKYVYTSSATFQLLYMAPAINTIIGQSPSSKAYCEFLPKRNLKTVLAITHTTKCIFSVVHFLQDGRLTF